MNPLCHKTLSPPVRFDSRIQIDANHSVLFTQGVFQPENPALADLFRAHSNNRTQAIAVVDSGVDGKWPDLRGQMEEYSSTHPDALEILETQVVPGGESAKNSSEVYEGLLESIDRAGLCRQSCVLAVGGGAVLDVAGYAASTAHRGIRLVRFPTTTLSQGDSGVGVKNGINRFGKKNFLGSFGVPLGVLNDIDFLTTLSDRDWLDGFSEAVKVSLIKDREFFETIHEKTPAIKARSLAESIPIVERSARLHFDHIATGGDPFEQTVARPLDFGHWAAHKIEQISGFTVSHGEAVAIGVALDTAYSAIAGHLSWEEADLLHSCLKDLGFRLYHESMANRAELVEGIEEFRQHLGGQLAITLLEGIGKGFTINEIDLVMVEAAIERIEAIG